MAIDYEVEYDNRARVPEHQQIFDRWSAENAAYRESASARGAELDLRYGSSERQSMDIFPAVDGDAAAAPLAMFIHGGWWRSLAPSMFGQLAAGPNKLGVTVAVAGYDLCPQVTIPTIIEQMRAACLWLWRKYHKRIMVYGHSAGGHLAACMVATDWKTLTPDAPADLVPAAYAISGVFDLAPLLQISVNDDLKLDEKTAHACSPLYWKVPAGRTLDAVVGALESSEFLRQSRTIAEAWRQGMAETRYEEIAGTNHFTVVDPLSDGNSAMSKRVAELARSVAAMAL
jgi:arylformamidase